MFICGAIIVYILLIVFKCNNNSSVSHSSCLVRFKLYHIQDGGKRTEILFAQTTTNHLNVVVFDVFDTTVLSQHPEIKKSLLYKRQGDYHLGIVVVCKYHIGESTNHMTIFEPDYNTELGALQFASEHMDTILILFLFHIYLVSLYCHCSMFMCVYLYMLCNLHI